MNESTVQELRAKLEGLADERGRLFLPDVVTPLVERNWPMSKVVPDVRRDLFAYYAAIVEHASSFYQSPCRLTRYRRALEFRKVARQERVRQRPRGADQPGRRPRRAREPKSELSLAILGPDGDRRLIASWPAAITTMASTGCNGPL
jgi:hypothetical protein